MGLQWDKLLDLGEMDIKKFKPTMQLVTAICLIALGSGLLIAGFVIPPQGEIHNSVLIAFGEILTFAGALMGIDYHYRAKGLGDKGSKEEGEK